jgi:hypothetical protein
MAAQYPDPSLSENPPPAAPEPRGFFRQFSPATHAELLAGLVFILLAVAGAAGVIKLRYEALALENDPLRIEGKVVRLWKTRANNGWRYRVEYEYRTGAEDDAPVVRNQTSVYEEYFNGLREGGPMTVVAGRTDPANHKVMGETPRIFSSTLAVLFSVGVVATLALAGVIDLWWWCVSRRMARTHQVHVGQSSQT